MLEDAVYLIVESRIFVVNNSIKLLLVGSHPVKFGNPCFAVCYTT
jgi:hypothetical protein